MTMMKTTEQTMTMMMEQTMTMMKTTEQTMTMMMEQTMTMMKTTVVMEMAVKEKATKETIQMNLRIAKWLAEEMLVMLAADTQASAGFFITDRHMMKIQKVYV